MKRDEQEDLRRREVGALEEINERLRELNIRPREEHPGRVEHLERFPALRTALRFCVHVRGVGDVVGLAQRFRRVPDEYVDGAGGAVRCLCGASVPFGDLTACPGGCGRWFAANAFGAYAARLEGTSQ